ncbi:MAG TPA: hypothetical protein VIY47_05395, partial [Ignavibacteriaceae bacterium]
RPPRVELLKTFPTFVPELLREQLNESAKKHQETRTDFLLRSVAQILRQKNTINKMKLQRTHPRSGDGWVLFHVPFLEEDVEKINKMYQEKDVSRASFLYSILLLIIENEPNVLKFDQPDQM